MKKLNYFTDDFSSCPNNLELQHKLEILQEEKKAILDKSSDAIFFIRSTGEILEANTRAVKLTGYPATDLVGMPVERLFAQPANLFLKKSTRKSDQLFPNCEQAVKVKQRGGSILSLNLYSSVIGSRENSVFLVLMRKPEAAELLPSNTGRSSSALFDSDKVAPESMTIPHEFPFIIGKSKKIREICKLVGQVAKTDSTVMIQGESGTGKEIFAHTIHHHSHRTKASFIRVNCVALSETLLESELFGHVEGAFTGAIRDRKGRFKQADGGTILLDEIGSMNLNGQAKLLRVLQEREFEPVGSSTTAKVDVRIIATTNTELMKAVKEGRFREDLYYRLSVINLQLPPLRRRKEDIPLLARHFLKMYAEKTHKTIFEISPETISILLNYPWRGNVRELKNVIEHAVVVENEEIIQPDSLPTRLETKEDFGHKPERKTLRLREHLAILEKQIVLQTLQKVNWIRKNAAKELGIDPRNFNYFLKKHNISASTGTWNNRYNKYTH